MTSVRFRNASLLCKIGLAGIFLIFLLPGCQRLIGSYDIDSSVSPKMTLTGKILLPTDDSATVRQQSINSVLAENVSASTQAANGAIVWLEECTDIPPQPTTSEGEYLFTDLPNGVYHVVAKTNFMGKTYKQRSLPVEPVPADIASPVADLLLAAAEKIVTGVLGSADGTPLPAGTVLTLWGEPFIVGANGTFESPPLPNDVTEADIVVVQTGIPTISLPRIRVPFFYEHTPTVINIALGDDENQPALSGRISC